MRVTDRVLHAPASGRPCVAFAVRIFEPSRHEPGGLDGTAPFDYVELCPFALECELGTIRVDSQFAELHVPHDRIGDDRIDRQRWLAFCEDKHASPASHGAEALILPGERVTLAGIVQRRQDRPGPGELAYRDGAAALWLVGDFDGPLLIGAAVDD